MSGTPTDLVAEPLVDEVWLRTHLGGSGLVVLDATVAKTVDGQYVSGLAGYLDDGHIRSARHADLIADFSDSQAPYPFARPSASAFEAAAIAHGINADSTVVIYDRRGGAWAARLWWLLRSFGHDAVHVLDGGLPAWVAAGEELETGVPSPTPCGSFRATPREGYFVDTPQVRSTIDSERAAHLVCALGRDSFTGRDLVAGRAGHIPGSVNVPYAELLDFAGRIDRDVVRRAIAASGWQSTSTGENRIIGYCGGGINAAGLALALSVVGITEVAVYDGSLSEWNSDAGNPLQIGEV